MRRALYMPIDWFDRLGHDASGCERGAWRQTATSASPSDRASGLLLHPPAVFGVHRGHAIIYMKRVGCKRPADDAPHMPIESQTTFAKQDPALPDVENAFAPWRRT